MIAIAVSLPTFIFLVWYFWTSRQLARQALIYFVAYGGLVLLAGCMQVDASLHANQFLFGARYFYPPVVLIVLAFIAIEQNSGRDRITLPIIASGLGSVYAAHVISISGYFTNRTWAKTASCIERSADCVVVLNPGTIGSVRVPSDSELLKMLLVDRLKFRDRQRFP
jgi:hypothetical protein